jgi:hypothetical protein
VNKETTSEKVTSEKVIYKREKDPVTVKSGSQDMLLYMAKNKKLQENDVDKLLNMLLNAADKRVGGIKIGAPEADEESKAKAKRWAELRAEPDALQQGLIGMGIDEYKSGSMAWLKNKRTGTPDYPTVTTPLGQKVPEMSTPTELYWRSMVSTGNISDQIKEGDRRKEIASTKESEGKSYTEEQLAEQADRKDAYEREQKRKAIDYSFEAANTTLDIFDMVESEKMAKLEERFAKESELLEQQLAREQNFAVEGSVFKAMLMDKANAKKKKLDAENEKQRRESEKRQKIIDIARAGIDIARGAISTAADVKGGSLFARLAAAATFVASMGAFFMQIKQANFRQGSGSRISNSSADDIDAKISVNERVLSEREIDRVGGPSALQEIIDRGKSFSKKASGNVVNLINPIGDKRYIEKNIIPYVLEAIA